MGCSAWVELNIRLHDLSRVVEVVRLSCWAPGAEALWAEKPELI